MERYMFASDIHGSAFWCRKLLSAFQESGAKKLILLGDILYHGPRNDLPEEYAPKEVIAMLNPLREKILCVRGNCEAEVDQMVLDFPCMADYGFLALNGLSFYATHGHVYNTLSEGENLPPMNPGEILIHGHTHIPVAETFAADRGEIYWLNPGSVSIPKGGFPNSYGLLTGTRFQVLDFAGGVIKEIDLKHEL